MVLTVNLVNSALVAVVLALYSGETPWLIFLVVTVALTALRLIGWRQYYSRLEAGLATAQMAGLGIGTIRNNLGRGKRPSSPRQSCRRDVRRFRHRRYVRRFIDFLLLLFSGFCNLRLSRRIANGRPILLGRLAYPRRHDGGVRGDDHARGVQLRSRLRDRFAPESRLDPAYRGTDCGQFSARIGNGAAQSC